MVVVECKTVEMTDIVVQAASSTTNASISSHVTTVAKVIHTCCSRAVEVWREACIRVHPPLASRCSMEIGGETVFVGWSECT